MDENLKVLLRRIRDAMSFDQYPSVEQTQEMGVLRQEIVKLLGEPDEWMESWDKMYKAQEKWCEKLAEDKK